MLYCSMLRGHDCAIAQMRQQPDYYLYYLFTLLYTAVCDTQQNRFDLIRFNSFFSFEPNAFRLFIHF